ncbi:hypothetical protein NUW58_g10812 [Xylaria curta]|uniref:Uncharacterized protein n=1 Tax=Xylaria curta TaxID=42375 RepID=A0ACC1MGP6_9PEZI|nr:hypothetical protein NUW58_g10812 [Xylaria curta]
MLSLTEASAPRDNGFGSQGYHNGLLGSHAAAATAAANVVFPRIASQNTSPVPPIQEPLMPPPAVPDKPAKAEKSKVKLFSRPKKIDTKSESKERPIPSPGKIGSALASLQRGIIVVDGREHTVTANLEAALREIRAKGWFNGHQSDSNLMLWVDALCINQQDKEEQAAQVMRMGQIYREAGNVLVWLKDDEPYGHMHGSEITSDLAIRYMQWLSAYYRTEHKAQSESAMVLGGIIADDIDIDDLGWFAIFHFVSNPYWRRLWIIQELAMGGHAMPILCRGRVTQWRHIRDSALIAAQISAVTCPSTTSPPLES